jgi:hypothetical protein
MSVHIKTGSCVARSWLKLETRKNRGIGKKKYFKQKKIVENKKKKVACVMRYVVIDRKRLYQLDGGGVSFRQLEL